MLITHEIFFDYLHCKYKTFIKLGGEKESKSDYELLQSELENDYRNNVISAKIKKDFSNKSILFNTLDDLKIGKKLILNVFLSNSEFVSGSIILERISGKSKFGKFYYNPIFFCRKNKISKFDKLLFTFNTVVLGQIQGRMPMIGKIFYGEKFQVSKLQIESNLIEVQKILIEIKRLAELNKEPNFSLFEYCRSCAFCKSHASEKDDLSLLRGMSVKDIQKWNSKGIFTVSQLSYTFRPRKRNKRNLCYKRKHLFELKALSIRERKIFVYEKPILIDNKIRIYFDIEGNEENTFHYLIGLVVLENGTEKHHSFWANSPAEEEMIINQFLNICNDYEDYQIFHYGNYEKRYLQTIKKKFPKKYDKKIDIVLSHSINILSFVYSNIYFPTYSNELKDIGNYLGFKWSNPNASGIQSLVWRTRWEITQNNDLKHELITYNLEDCFALKQITDLIYRICNNTELVSQNSEHPELTWTQDFQSETSYKWGKARFFFQNFEVINKCAYFDYQRDKIFIRTNKNIRKNYKQKIKSLDMHYKVNQVIKIRKPYGCYNCNSLKIVREREKGISKTVIDLKFTKNGVKKWIIQYKTSRYMCTVCKRVTTPKSFKAIKGKHGRNLISWVIYNLVENKMNIEMIIKNLKDISGIILAKGTLHSFKGEFALYYQFTYKKLIKQLLTGKILHVDETQVRLRTKDGYVWVFTNMDVAILLYKSSREGEFLKNFLKNFHGILISDFYSAYDSLDCQQQKCLVHLIRDLNQDLFKNPFDEEFKDLVEKFGILLREIINTIDKYGLKKRNLNKHKVDIKRYYAFLNKQKFSSELAQKYKKRFKKNRDKLFTFLNYDGVPWNNNNAENAIKHFAIYRRFVDGYFTESSLIDYLLLLSIYQTCKYKGINFLQFLLSRKKDIDKF